MLTDESSKLLTYVTLYSVVIAAALLALAPQRRTRGSAVLGLSCLVIGLGFPPSPLFLLKLTLGSSCASVLGVCFCLCLGLLLLVAWVRFAYLVTVVSGLGVSGAKGGLAGRRYTTPCAAFGLGGLVLLLCTPVGLALVCAL